MKYVVALAIAIVVSVAPVLLFGPRLAVISVPLAVVVAWVYLSDKVGRHSQRRTRRA